MCAHATSHAGGSPSKTLEGSLSSFNLFEILQFLRLGAMTGVLTVEREDEQIQLMVRDGKIVNSSIFTHRQRLGELLLVRGIVTRRELDEMPDGVHLLKNSQCMNKDGNSAKFKKLLGIRPAHTDAAAGGRDNGGDFCRIH